MQGNTNARLGGSGSADSGDVINAVNKTGAPIVQGQKVWVNREGSIGANVQVLDQNTYLPSSYCTNCNYVLHDSSEFEISSQSRAKIIGVNSLVPLSPVVNTALYRRNLFDNWYLEYNANSYDLSFYNDKINFSYCAESGNSVSSWYRPYYVAGSRFMAAHEHSSNSLGLYEFDLEGKMIRQYTNAYEKFGSVYGQYLFKDGDYIYHMHNNAKKYGKLNRTAGTIDDVKPILGSFSTNPVVDATPDGKFIFHTNNLYNGHAMPSAISEISCRLYTGVFLLCGQTTPEASVWFEDGYGLKWVNAQGLTGAIAKTGYKAGNNFDEISAGVLDAIKTVKIIQYKDGKFVGYPVSISNEAILKIKQSIQEFIGSGICDNGQISTILVAPNLSYISFLLVFHNKNSSYSNYYMTLILWLDCLSENGCYVYASTSMTEGTLIGKALENADVDTSLKVATVLADNTTLTVTTNADHAEINLE